MNKLEIAVAKVREGSFEEALERFRSLVDDPEYGLDALGHRAWLYRSLGRWEEAILDYQSLIAARPEDLQATVLLAETKLMTGQAEAALGEAVEVLRRDPKNLEAARVLGRCHQALGLFKGELPSTPATEQPIYQLNSVIEKLEQDPQSFCFSIHPLIGRLLYAFVRCCRPRQVLETGCFIGYSSLWIAQALKDNGEGHLHSFDMFARSFDYQSPVVGPCTDMLSVARGHIEHAGLTDYVSLYKGDSSAKIRENFQGKGRCVDMAFIDGDHNLQGCLKDWFIVDELLSEGGLVLLHDTEPEQARWLGPRYLLEELGRRDDVHYHWLNLPTVDGTGLGIIQKKHQGTSPSWRPSLKELVAQRLFNANTLMNIKKSKQAQTQ